MTLNSSLGEESAFEFGEVDVGAMVVLFPRLLSIACCFAVAETEYGRRLGGLHSTLLVLALLLLVLRVA